MTEERLQELISLGEDVLMHLDQDSDYIAHYGRIGMKWYQHIYGDYQGAAKYAQKGAKKVAKMKDRYDKKYTPKIVKVLTTDSEHAVENAKKLNKAMEKDIAKIRKVEEVMNEAKAIADKDPKKVLDNRIIESLKEAAVNEVKLKKDLEVLHKDGWTESDYRPDPGDTPGATKILERDTWSEKLNYSYTMLSKYDFTNETTAEFKKRNNDFTNIVEGQTSEIKEAAWEEHKNWAEKAGITKQEFSKRLKLTYVSMPDKNSKIQTALVEYDDDLVLGGHTLSVEMDMNGKWNHMSLNG